LICYIITASVPHWTSLLAKWYQVPTQSCSSHMEIYILSFGNVTTNQCTKKSWQLPFFLKKRRRWESNLQISFCIYRNLNPWSLWNHPNYLLLKLLGYLPQLPILMLSFAYTVSKLHSLRCTTVTQSLSSQISNHLAETGFSILLDKMVLIFLLHSEPYM
jgi:hypothetical protein